MRAAALDIVGAGTETIGTQPYALAPILAEAVNWIGLSIDDRTVVVV